MPRAAFDLEGFFDDAIEFQRLQRERKHARVWRLNDLALSDAKLAPLFEDIERGVRAGLSLRDAGAAHGVTARLLEAWVHLAEDGRRPWASWLTGLRRWAAEAHQQALADLQRLGEVDLACRRDWLRQRGKASRLELELVQLRRSRTASTDTLIMPSDAERNDASTAGARTAQGGIDAESVGDTSQPSESTRVAPSDVEAPESVGES